MTSSSHSMLRSPRRFHVAAIALACGVAATSCSAPEVQWARPVVDVVPSGDGGAWVFDVAGARHANLPAVRLPDGGGLLRAVAKDQSRGYGAALYDGALAIVDIENDLIEWTGALPQASQRIGPASLAFGARDLGMTAGKGAAVIGIPSGEVSVEYDLTQWLDSYSLQRANLFVPLGEGRFALVASRVPTAFSDGRVVIQGIDTTRGVWRLTGGEGDLAGLDRIGAATAVGGTIYVAGIVEQIARGTGTGRGTMHQSVVAFRFDPATSSSFPVVEENQIALDPRVLDIAAGRDPETGRDMLAILNATGDVRIYDIHVSGTTSAPLYSNRFEGATSLAWVSSARIAVGIADGTVQRIDVTR